jgi:putative protease
LRAAVENGADAIYFGLERGFNARARATNFRLDNLSDIMRGLRQRRVRGYVTLNTLVFSDELVEFEEIVRQVAAAGVDAVLVQDLGAARLIREICPDLAIHASTQMTLTSAECIDAVAALGIRRVVLPRELSIDEIRLVADHTEVPLEVFAHGALCVAYSGQCLTSESLGGRSANRGQCAQACRLPYEIYCDGQHIDLGNQKYLLSPQDLVAYDLVPQLMDAGVAALKIEGRLKSPEYVASITARYREAIDAATHGLPLSLAEHARDEMEMTFSRGLAPGWLEGCDHKRLVPGLSSAKRGVLVGEVVRVVGERVTVRLARSVKPGDGVMFDCGRAQNEQPGGRVFEIWQHGRSVARSIGAGVVELAFRHGSGWIADVAPGQNVWKTDDPQLSQRLRQSYTASDPRRRIPISLNVHAYAGEVLRITATLPDGRVVHAHAVDPLEPARRHCADPRLFEEQLNRLGHTPFELKRLECDIQSRPMVPLSVLGKLRREVVQRLLDTLGATPARAVSENLMLPRLRPSLTSNEVAPQPPQLHLLCRSLEQLGAAIESEASEVSIDLSDVRQYREAVRLGRRGPCRVAVVTPRIHKPGELGVFKTMLRYEPQAVVARNLAAVRYFVRHDVPVVADYSLNVANELTAEFIKQMGVERLTASYDLNRDQLMRLIAAMPPEWLEVVIHQHMPMFHMEHCVFCAVLSPGTNKSNCGRPCDRHVVHLEDRVGMRHSLTADVGCRNTLFNAQPQSAAEIVPELVATGVRWLRIEFLEHTSAADVSNVASLYHRLLQRQVSGKEVWSRLKAANRVGVTRGTLEAARNPLAIL